jgi:hypothetical protein
MAQKEKWRTNVGGSPTAATDHVIIKAIVGRHFTWGSSSVVICLSVMRWEGLHSIGLRKSRFAESLREDFCM